MLKHRAATAAENKTSY